ncbi:MAG: DEAD/DEAH box helicase [Candidatus Latescibacteria bacterium]|nr:DEAD/DEAH box helicase [Candidatus Latescibacterota bacterium]MDP7447250.1 DEAD/DEAH box helicase [Candidatus Latescibacterota bacterium]HJP33530.1 DEAD/DEAH box helicase [Candidatus Latescibacterota bacterium]
MQTDRSIRFDDLDLLQPILRAVQDEGYSEPSPVQAAAIPIVLEGGDLIATAKTGTGKTAAFAIPMLQLLHESGAPGDALRGLILTPTRELALQIHESLRTYGRHLKLTHAVVVGGVSAGPQIQAMRRRPDILVATPGRLLDLMGQGKIRLRDIEMAVLDEADRMLDMGFIRDVRRIVDSLPNQRQTLLFSATMSREITELAGEMLHKPARVEVTPPATVADNITQKVLFVDQADKRNLLARLLKEDQSIASALVFTRTRHRANRVARQLSQAGIKADAIHSDKSQGARQKALEAFDRGRVRVLVATDIVARGIDVEGITHVINFEIPNEAESYVHRIGRTARAGAAGIALSFCNSDEIAYLADIEKLTGVRLEEVDDHPHRSSSIAALRDSGKAPAKKKSQSSSGQGGTSRGPRRPSGNAQGNGGRRGGPQRHKRTDDSGANGASKSRRNGSRDERRGEPKATPKVHFGRRPRAA